MKTEGDYNQIKTKLSKIYISLKNNINKGNINIEENPDSEENEENSDKNLSIMQLINCISIYTNYLIEIKNKNNEEINKEEDNEEKPLYKQYEELLIKAEDDIRRHIRIEQQLKIKIEDLEFELDDYRTGKIKKKVKNLVYLNEPGYYSNYNYPKQKNKFSEFNNYNSTNNNDKNNKNEKPISVNSNNNYLISKLKKENESLKIKLSKLENESNNSNNINYNDKYRQIENKILHKKLNEGIRITKNIINNQNYISKNNYYSFANNTYTNNFYNIKENKYKSNNNSTINDININLKNYNKIIFNNNTETSNSFVAYPNTNNTINKSETIKTFQIVPNNTINKIKSNSKKIIYDKNKTQFKKINNNNFIEIKIKEENNNSYNIHNSNKIDNSRIHTLNNNNNNNNNKNIFTKKKNIIKKKTSKLNLNMTNSNLYNTDRKKHFTHNKIETNANIDSNAKERNTLNIPNYEFNLTWSKFPMKINPTSLNIFTGQYFTTHQKNSIQSLIRNSTNINNNVNKSLNKKLLSQFNSNKKNKNAINFNPNKFPNKIKKDTTPHKITINRRKMVKTKTNNSSMKNINYINYTKPKMKDEFNINNKDYIESLMNSCENNKMMMTKTQNHFYNGKGDIYVRKKQSSALVVDAKNKKFEIKKNDNYQNINNNYDQI